MDTFNLVRAGLPNTAVIAAMVLLPLMLIVTGGTGLLQPGVHSNPAVAQLAAATAGEASVQDYSVE